MREASRLAHEGGFAEYDAHAGHSIQIISSGTAERSLARAKKPPGTTVLAVKDP